MSIVQKIWYGIGLLVLMTFWSIPTIIAHVFRPNTDSITKPIAVAKPESAQYPTHDQYEALMLFGRQCAMCHNWDGSGKIGIAPSIGNRDFLALSSDEFIKQTVREGRVGTAMVPRRDLTNAQLDQIIGHLRSLHPKEIKPIAVDPLLSFDGVAEQGGPKYAAYCSSCHGPNGEGYTAGGVGPGIGLPGFLEQVSDDYILQTVKHGRVGTPMRAFIGSQGLANLAEEDVHDIIAFLRQRNPATRAHYEEDMGLALYDRHCAMCHQPEGRGKVGLAPSIGNRDFLALASDQFITRTVRRGRVGTAMAPRPDLTDRQLEQIITYLRTLPGDAVATIHVDEDLEYDGDGAHGRAVFATYCSPCHGVNGEGYAAGGSGPAIRMPGFLNVVSDDFIFKTVKYGRTGTPMRSFIGARGLANLAEADVRDVISFLRNR